MDPRQPRRWWWPGSMALALILLGACGGDEMTDETNDADDGSTTVEAAGVEAAGTTAPTGSTTPTTSVPSTTSGSALPAMEQLVRAAIADLADRSGVDPSEIEVVSADAVTWPDAGLGCPDPDMRYTQVPVDGTLIVLAIGDVDYEYHSGGSTPPFLCEPPR